MDILVRYYLRVDPAQDLDELMQQHAEALWIEERQAQIMTTAMAKAMGGK